MLRIFHLPWLLLFVVWALAACAPGTSEKLSRYEPTGLPPVMPGGDFEAYIKASRAHIETVSLAVDETPLGEQAVAAIAPFELKPRPPGKDCKAGAVSDYNRGVLLIHGHNDTPYAMWDLAAAFGKACYMVRSILLPGHGTVPGDLTRIGLDDWRKAVHKAIWSFRGEVDRLVLAGFDLGANLALEAALDRSFPPEVELNGVVMLAPAFGYRPPQFGPAAMGPGGDALWGDVFEERQRLQYLTTVRSSVDAVNQLGQALYQRNAPRHIPLFVVASADDAVSDPDLVQSWFCGQETAPRQLLWYTRYPCRPMRQCHCTVRSRKPGGDQRQTCVVNRSVAHDLGFDNEAHDFRRTTPQACQPDVPITPNPGILELSHAGLLAAPDNPRYGSSSGRRDCLHYSWALETPEEKVCVGALTGEGERHLRQGEASGANLRNYILQRLTYNPDFDFMAAAILDFLKRND